ncbi:hypothetical protein PRK78_005845 [Emydomyces testavorans]|uniref:Uncharacterized protein n=1 Tax=Emydomyces testavorans TaxID=2070801 RepID=A0AAF0DKD6_9EURO|nr:hypothetical protein PRK78_005845 [Emydomyces testavorans]
MGQSHSSNGGSSHQRDFDGTDSQKDLYEILGIEPLATTEEIKKAYRKKALELHPDKNYGNVEAATALFAEAQAAYEVLSDPQERAWYDSHRDAIMYDANNPQKAQFFHDSKLTGTEEILRTTMKFTPGMEFSDSPSGFFGAVREIFEQLAKEETNACIWEGLEPIYFPSFGSKDDSFDTVRPFYNIWGSFATKKSFQWKDVYKYSEAPDRRVRRLMEKENKRLRDEAIRDFNDAVRSLVSFVKKRDPRFKAAVQDEAERQKLLRVSAAMQAARSRAANEARLGNYSVPDWAQREAPEEEMLPSETESEEDHFACVVCRKTFKSEKQFEAHERSKKHIKAVKQLRYEMRTEDEHLQLNGFKSQDVASLDPEERASRASTVSVPEPNPVIATTEVGNPDAYKTGILNEEITARASISGDHVDAEGAENLNNYTSHENTQTQPVTTDPLERSGDEDLIGQVNESLATSCIADDLPIENPARKKVGKAKQKRAKRMAQNAGQKDTFNCGTCGNSFTSRNKLFCHINEKDHALPVTRSTLPKKST